MRARMTSATARATAGMVAVAALGTLLGGCSSLRGPAAAAVPAPEPVPGVTAVSGAGPASSSGTASGYLGSGKVGGKGGGKGGIDGGTTGNTGIGGHTKSNNSGNGGAGIGPGYHDSRITLPETVGLSFSRPKQTDWTEHEVLSAVQQALRAQLHSEYIVSGSSTDPLLSVYWSASALTAAQNEIATWVKKGRQPVGVLVITDTAYTAPDPAGKSVVRYCANWSDEVADQSGADTRTARSAAQPSPDGTQGMYTSLTLTRADKHHWQVQSLAAKADPVNCPGSTTAQ